MTLGNICVPLFRILKGISFGRYFELGLLFRSYLTFDACSWKGRMHEFQNKVIIIVFIVELCSEIKSQLIMNP